nr:RecName: Full=Probable alpha-fetoprotein; AltName: Full=Alpha-1-fetoprotein; AltName: Full=Alpha-fetoglobulin [Bos indicus]
DKNAYGIDLIL